MGATFPEIGRAYRFKKPSIIQEDPASFLIRAAAAAQFDYDEPSCARQRNGFENRDLDPKMSPIFI
jgi:hypothetical protein